VAKPKEMLLAAEKWRKEFGVEELVKWVASLTAYSIINSYLGAPRTFDFAERTEVDRYLPQYYHVGVLCEKKFTDSS
jgi:hypothetical protein